MIATIHPKMMCRVKHCLQIFPEINKQTNKQTKKQKPNQEKGKPMHPDVYLPPVLVPASGLTISKSSKGKLRIKTDWLQRTAGTCTYATGG